MAKTIKEMAKIIYDAIKQRNNEILNTESENREKGWTAHEEIQGKRAGAV